MSDEIKHTKNHIVIKPRLLYISINFIMQD